MTCWQLWHAIMITLKFMKHSLLTCWQSWHGKNHKEKNLILSTGKRKFVDFLPKLTNKKYKLNIFETELVVLLTNLTCQKSQRKKFDHNNWKKEICWQVGNVDKEIVDMTTVLKKNFQFFHKLKLVDLLTMMTCNNDNLKIYEIQLVDLFPKLT